MIKLLKFVIVISIIVFIVMISYAFSIILNYVEDEQYKSSLPTIEVTGFLTDDGNERHIDLGYSILELDYEKARDSRYYLQDTDIDPQLVGEYVRIIGYLEINYAWEDGFDYAVMPPSVKVIYVKELEIMDSPLIID